MKKYKILEQERIKNKISKQLNKLKKYYNDSFDWSFTNIRDSGYIINLYWFDDSITKITPEFDPYDINFELLPTGYILGNMSINKFKTISEIVKKEAKIKLR